MSSPEGEKNRSADPAANRVRVILAPVKGTAPRVAISYLNDIGIQEQRDLAPPWTFGFRARAGRQLLLNVQRDGETGAVGCAIAVNGQVVRDIPAEESRATASCEAIVP